MPGDAKRSVIVVGSTGVLRPAATTLEQRGDAVIGVSRHGESGSIGVDARDPLALRTALDGRAWDDAVIYDRAVSPSSLAFLRAATPGRCVLVRASAAADPRHGILVVPRDTLQLGWRPSGDGAGPIVSVRPGAEGLDRGDGAASRWHSPEEISVAALAVLADGTPRTLGAVRPWSDRP